MKTLAQLNIGRGAKTVRAVDLFCGAGGGSVALRRACDELGLKLDLMAVNHSPVAIETHRRNHPETCHLCESVERVDPKTKVFVDPVTGVRFKNTGRLDILIAGPECTHHSTARGGRPINDQSRATAWHILKWAQELYIDNILIENVPEFREWGPIGANHRPLKSRRGETFRAFIEALKSLGYKVDYNVFNAADYGDPTTRRRLFMLARRGNRTISIPAPTHSKAGGRNLFGKLKKWRSAREDVIDWSLTGQSVFNRKRPLSPKTWARIMAGLEKYGGDDLKPFLIVLRNNMGARSVDEPIPALSAGGTHVGLVQPSMGPLSVHGNAGVPDPFVVHVTHGGGEDRVTDINGPLPTVTGAHNGELALVEPFMLDGLDGPLVETSAALFAPDPFVVTMEHRGSVRSIDAPLPTITTAKGGAFAVVEPFVLQQQSGGVPRAVSQPLPTIATDGAIALIDASVSPAGEPFMLPPRHMNDGTVDSVDAPLRTITAAAGHVYAVAESFLVPHYGERPGQPPRTHSIDEPVPTIPASGDGKFEVVQTFVVSAGGPKVDAISTEQPLNTVLTRDHMALVEPIIASYYGTQNVSPVDAPLPTVTAKDRFALVQPVVNGRALDIRLRMLKPHELARAMSFGDDYQFAGNQGEKVKQIGNAWPCRLGQALITTLLVDYAKAKKVTTKLEGVA